MELYEISFDYIHQGYYKGYGWVTYDATRKTWHRWYATVQNVPIFNTLQYTMAGYTWVVLQKLPQLSDTHFSQVLNKLEKIFFMVL